MAPRPITNGPAPKASYSLIVARQKSAPKRKKYVFRICTLSILLYIIIINIIPYTPLVLIFNNKIF